MLVNVKLKGKSIGVLVMVIVFFNLSKIGKIIRSGDSEGEGRGWERV